MAKSYGYNQEEFDGSAKEREFNNILRHTFGYY